MTLENCFKCGDPTGRAGRGDDSLYVEDIGPYCRPCFDEANPPDSAPQDAVELARDVIKRSKRGASGEGAIILAKAVLDMQEHIDKLEAVNEHIEAVNNKLYNQLHVAKGQITALRTALEGLLSFVKFFADWERQNGTMSMITQNEWKELYEPLTTHCVEHSPRSVESAALSTTPPAAPSTPMKSPAIQGASAAAAKDLQVLVRVVKSRIAPSTTAIVEVARKVLKEYYAGSTGTNLSDLSTAINDYDQALEENDKTKMEGTDRPRPEQPRPIERDE